MQFSPSGGARILYEVVGGQPNLERRSPTLPIERANRSVVQCNQVLGDREAEAGTGDGATAVDAIETVEDPLDVFGRNPLAMIGDAQHGVAVLGRDLDQDFAACVLR